MGIAFGMAKMKNSVRELGRRLGREKVEIVYSDIARYNILFGNGVREEDAVPVLEELGYKKSKGY